ncbi:MAG: hypothetical protein ACI90V_013987 [Bacillariaceae sp.]
MELDCCQHPKPIGRIESLDTFTGTTFFEVAEAQFDLPNVEIVLEFSIWANEGDGDCDRLGTDTRLDDYFQTGISELSKYLS